MAAKESGSGQKKKKKKKNKRKDSASPATSLVVRLASPSSPGQRASTKVSSPPSRMKLRSMMKSSLKKVAAPRAQAGTCSTTISMRSSSLKHSSAKPSTSKARKKRRSLVSKQSSSSTNTIQQRKQLKAIFERLDRDGDGMVNRRELIISLRKDKDETLQKFFGF